MQSIDRLKAGAIQREQVHVENLLSHLQSEMAMAALQGQFEQVDALLARVRGLQERQRSIRDTIQGVA